MKVLFNGLQAGNRSGTGQYTTQLARWLPELAEDVDIAIVWPKETAVPEGAINPGCHFLPQDTRILLKRLYLDQFGIRRMADRIEADLVHFPASVGNQLGPPNMVVTIHDLSFMRNPAWFRRDRALYYQATIGRSATLARRVIADSTVTAGDLRDQLGIPEDHIDVIPLGVDADFHRATEAEQSALRAEYGLPQRFFLYVGTIEPRKNLTRLIGAWSHLARQCPLDLVIAGRDGWKVGPIHTEARRSPYAARIHFVGFVPRAELPALYSAAEAFVWPSLWEGFGLPPLEAMACETPVLTSNTASLPEVVGSGALLVNPEDVGAITEGMARLATDAPLRASLIAAGLEQAAKYTWRRTAELTVASYRKALQT